MTAEDKPSLRSHYLHLRKNIPEETKQALDQEIFKHFFRSVTLEKNSTIAGYYPVNGEVNVLPILQSLTEQGYSCVLPMIKGKSQPLEFAHWDDSTPVEKNNNFPVPEPVGTTTAIPTILLVPLVAFDNARHRLGYGGGLYDRTLEHLKKAHTVFTIGIGYECQACDTLPIETTDIPMDMILTEKHVYV